ncbi:UDP-N-acetylglucosamine 1-carboxyvinyltransferase [Bacillus sp. UNCCL81]|uniref:UDP-N-acetylglucosamine 1-carboxyvinyltransferase n=1 Tax=Bacillus sp. UNCCL81 TaxID=1502755 RepID=UPI00041DEE12|nr:UDP-N-acetylglucosamine 1-carboxyvinyltransferase [Bacillus sp. UNCCL81]SFD61243.1 UDP-N-acetylglucosamine 1-carboxyvinyltransferase [Bacillus sp. UNCCL81]
MSVENKLLSSKTIRINGGKRLRGETTVDGAKNSVILLIPAACVATRGVTNLENVPLVSDVDVMIDIMDEIGIISSREGSTLSIDSTSLKSGHISQNLMSKIRHSILFLGPLVAALGEAKISLPGGDNFGDRPIDIHISALKSLGIDTTIENGIIYAKAKELPLKAANINLRFPSFGATVQSILTACRAVGTTVIENAAIDPEIVDLILFLNKMGANVQVSGTRKITVQGVENLEGVNHQVIPDRLEAGALLVAFAVTRGEGIIHGVIPEHNGTIIALLKEIGLELKYIGTNSISVFTPKELQSICISASPFPGLSTDMQPQIVSLATICQGESVIKDTVFDGRFSICAELRKMGALIEIDRESNLVRINGVGSLKGTHVEAKDIRAAVGLVCAGIAATGTTYLSGLEHLHRGHGNLVNKLYELGAEIEYVSE